MISFVNSNALFSYLKKLEDSSSEIISSKNWHIITVNDRLSRYLHQEYQKFIDLSVITMPAIDSLEVWLQNFYDVLLEKYPNEVKQKINFWQAQLLWIEILSKQPQHLSIHLIEEAYKAYELLMDYCVDINVLSAYYHEASQLLYKWINIYQKRCQQLQIIDPFQCKKMIIKLTEQEIYQNRANVFLAKHIFFVGFDTYTPYIKHLIQCLVQLNIVVDSFKIIAKKPKIQGVIFNDSQEELYGMLEHALNIIKENPNQKIACILPNPSTKRQAIKKAFSRLQQQSSLLSCYSLLNFSAGPSLLDYPYTQYLHHVLNFDSLSCTYTEFSLFLLSPHCPGAKIEKFFRANFDLFLRQQESYYLNFHYIVQLIKKNNFIVQCPILYELLKKIIALHKKRKLMLPSNWVDYYDNALQIFLPSNQSTISNNYLILQKIMEIIVKLSTLDAITGKISYEKIQSILIRTFASTIYQPQNKLAKIHIIGILEASGMSFDHAWIASLHNNNWPPTTIANSFLPIDLQNKYGMPHCNINKELDFTEKVTARLLLCAKQITLSTYHCENDELLLPSPLLAQYFEKSLLIKLSLFPKQWLSLLKHQELEYIEDNNAPKIFSDNSFNVGSSVFQLQAQCPFRAFATLRLHAQPTPLPTPGISAHLRGTLVHHSLEKIWQQLKNHEMLIQKSEFDLKNLIEEKIEQALINYQQRYPCAFTNKIRNIEKNRLINIIFSWLNYEKSRSPFIVLSLEHIIQLTIGALKLSLKIDRIDTVAPDNIVIIDYKTGMTDINIWFGERPENLQLPLYAIAYGQKLAALVFASVKPQAISFKGITNIARLLPDVTLNEKVGLMNGITFEDQYAIWKKQLQQLADEFCSGIATVTPLHQNICKTCELMPLCRIHQYS